MPAEALTAEELERTRTEYTNCRDLQASGVIDAMEAAPFTDWVGRVLATIDARDAALRQAEEDRDNARETADKSLDGYHKVQAMNARQSDALRAAEEAIRRGLTWDQYQSALREGR